MSQTGSEATDGLVAIHCHQLLIHRLALGDVVPRANDSCESAVVILQWNFGREDHPIFSAYLVKSDFLEINQGLSRGNERLLFSEKLLRHLPRKEVEVCLANHL